MDGAGQTDAPTTTGDDDDSDASIGVVPPAKGAAQILVRHEDGHWIRIEAHEGAQPENLTASLDAISKGEDEIVSISGDAAWLAMTTTRFGCVSGACVAVIAADLSGSGEIVKIGGDEIESIGRPIIAPGGNVLVFEKATPGGHSEDLYATTRSGGAWGTPVLLTGASNHGYHHDPAFSPDGARVAFDCGEDPYGDTAGTESCEVAVDGSGFRTIFSLPSFPGARASAYAQRPSYAPDGTFVIEGNAAGVEELYRVARGGAPALISPNFEDDNSPCVLRDGQIASLWLGRAENKDAVHELKLMSADGKTYTMLLPLVPLVDLGLACGG